MPDASRPGITDPSTVLGTHGRRLTTGDDDAEWDRRPAKTADRAPTPGERLLLGTRESLRRMTPTAVGWSLPEATPSRVPTTEQCTVEATAFGRTGAHAI